MWLSVRADHVRSHVCRHVYGHVYRHSYSHAGVLNTSGSGAHQHALTRKPHEGAQIGCGIYATFSIVTISFIIIMPRSGMS